MKSNLYLLTLLLALPALGLSQTNTDDSNKGNITGNFAMIWQSYSEDSLIGAQVPDERTGFNAWGNLIYQKGGLTAGIRYESYLNPLLGYPGRFKGTGIGYRFAQYKSELFEVTLGNFYDQFGSGLAFRSYEERYLGLDNAMDGIRLIVRPIDGIQIKTLYGKQRFDFDGGLINGPGIVRAVDAELHLNRYNEALHDSKLQVTLGGSFVSRYQGAVPLQKDTLLLQMPDNVGLYSGRMEVFYGNFNFYGEYVRKINDPNADNNYVFKPGEGYFANLTYSKPGFGINLHAKMVDNLSFRSDRDQLLFDVPINFIPAVTKVHTYNLAATLYPYATVLDGESGFSFEIFKKLKPIKNLPDDAPFHKKLRNKLVGKYGTNLTINFAAANNIDTTGLRGAEGLVFGYQRNSLGFGKEKFIRDFNVEIDRKFSKDFKAKYSFYYFEFNTEVTPVTIDFKGIVYANIHVLELNNRLAKNKSLRTEVQALFTDQDKGDWATLLFEYSYSPHWFISVMDQYNFGNPNPAQRVHYLFGTVGYINGAHRLSVGYGKRREGIFCVGGVCRAVPASNGFEITYTTSF